jgi:tRNA threonylcarbamoyladenosine biosynthesis protein TsaB
MPLLLSIETSTSICSVAIHEDGHLLHAIQNQVPQSASSQLAVMIQQALAAAEKKTNQLRGVVVASGPGSYTGLRIGVATAKGICYALQVPLVAVNTLELLAYQFHLAFSKNAERDSIFCPMIDARRMEVYCMLTHSDLSILEPTHAKVIDSTSFEEVLAKQPMYFFGNGADKCKEAITHPKANFISGMVPSADKLGEMGMEKFKRGLFEEITTFEPLYLKDFLIRKPNPA